MLAIVFATGSAAQEFEIHEIGLDGPEFVSRAGFSLSQPYYVRGNEVIGETRRYLGNANNGNGAWHFDGTNTTRLGFYGPNHTSDEGEQFSTAWFNDDTGEVVGMSRLFEGSGTHWTAWVFDGNDTTTLGLMDSRYLLVDGFNDSFNLRTHGNKIAGQNRFFGNRTDITAASIFLQVGSTVTNLDIIDAKHTNARGVQSSWAEGFGVDGTFYGRSSQYFGRSQVGAAGFTVWTYLDGVRTELGLLEGQFKRPSDGATFNEIEGFDSQGRVLGNARISDGINWPGQVGWLRDGNSTITFALTDEEHTDALGYSRSRPLGFTGNWIVGSSQRGNQGALNGFSAWVYDIANDEITKVGPVDAEHTRADGYQNHYVFDNSYPETVSSNGLVFGSSYRYNGTADQLGQSAWVYDGNSTTLIGLLGGEFQGSGGESTNRRFTQYPFASTGTLAGETYRYDGSQRNGIAAWFFDGQTTHRIGLTSSEYISSTGRMDSTIRFVNSLGQIVGNSIRYNGANSNGQVAWFFDPATMVTTPLFLSQNSSTGYATSYVNRLTEEGVCYGQHNVFDGAVDLGSMAFKFSTLDGFTDINALAGDAVADAGFSSLFSATVGEGSRVAGFGPLLTDPGTYRAFLLKRNSKVSPINYVVARGDHNSGGIEELITSDNQDLSVSRSASDVQALFQVDFYAESPVATPPSFTFTLEASVFSRSQIDQTIELFDFEQNQFETVSTDTASRFVDGVFTAEPTGNVERFVNPNDNTVRARVSYSSGPQRQRFTANIDQVCWDIE